MRRGTPLTPDWRIRAACLDEDPELFFPDPSETKKIAQAKAVCDTCPVQQECQADTSPGDRWAVRAGTTPEERGVPNYRKTKVAA